jgi:hypothetical protein
MSPWFRATALALLVVPLAGCYHATIETGLPAGQEKISQPWAMSFIYGLVPPPTVAVASRCPNGVAKVETQMSFLNGLVSSLTFGILTPMQIDVTCASGSRDDHPEDLVLAAGPDHRAALQRAAEISATRKAPVLVQF